MDILEEKDRRFSTSLEAQLQKTDCGENMSGLLIQVNDFLNKL